MSEAKSSLSGSALPESIAEAVDAAADLLAETLGANLESLVITGHLVHEPPAKGQMIESVVVIKEDLITTAEQIAGIAGKLARLKFVPPLLMTASYIERSMDVFPLEFLHIQAYRHVAYGADPFAELTFEKADVRTQLEREAKRFLIQLRQGLMRCRGNDQLIRQQLHELVHGAMPMILGVLFLHGDVRNGEARLTRSELLQQFANVTRIDATPFSAVLSDVHGSVVLEDTHLERTLRACNTMLESIAEWANDA